MLGDQNPDYIRAFFAKNAGGGKKRRDRQACRSR